mmetsp:Transcript_6902/g.15247  ORF Transcript_6902/g.15247 Transcript_6902/m.15247 type:complete len:289 (+) Transcript_6902:2046-2912(+)
MGSSTLSKMRFQNESANVPPWYLSVSNSTSSALLRISGRGSNVSSDRPASSGNQKYTCSSLSTNLSTALRADPEGEITPFASPAPGAGRPLGLAAPELLSLGASARGLAGGPCSTLGACGLGSGPMKEEEGVRLSMATTRRGCTTGTEGRPSGSSSTSPMAPSASFMAQNLRNAMELSATSRLCGLLVKAMRQLTQSVKVVVSVSVMWLKCSRTIFSMVSNASRTIMGSLSPAAVVNTMNMDFQPDLTLLTRASTIWDKQRMMSSRISTAWLCLITTTKGRRKSFWKV